MMDNLYTCFDKLAAFVSGCCDLNNLPRSARRIAICLLPLSLVLFVGLATIGALVLFTVTFFDSLFSTEKEELWNGRSLKEQIAAGR